MKMAGQVDGVGDNLSNIWIPVWIILSLRFQFHVTRKLQMFLKNFLLKNLFQGFSTKKYFFNKFPREFKIYHLNLTPKL